MIRCLVIDDEPLAREGIAEYILEIEYLSLVEMCDSALSALNVIEEKEIDSYPSFALEGYDLNVLDYLVKPVTMPRFLKAVEKAKTQYDLLQQKTSSLNPAEEFFFVKTDNKFEKIRIGDIHLVESMQNYVKIVCADKQYVSLLPLKTVKANLPSDLFCQTHKSYLVNISHIESLEGMQVTIYGKSIPIGRTHKQEVYDRVVRDNLLEK